MGYIRLKKSVMKLDYSLEKCNCFPFAHNGKCLYVPTETLYMLVTTIISYRV